MRPVGVACCVGAVAGSLLLGGCVTARDPVVVSTAALKPVGNWRVERQTDRITGAPVSSAYLTTRSSHSKARYPRPAFMQLSCFKDQPLVRFAFEVKIGSNRNSEFSYRFDNKPGGKTDARFLQDFKTAVIEDKAALAFLKELRQSELLYIHIRSLNAGRTAAEFRLEGADGAIDTALAGCLPASTRTAAR